MKGLMLHAGARQVTLDEVIDATPPAPTETWFPVAYGDLVKTTKESLEATGLEVVEEGYGLFDQGGNEAMANAMFFGLLTLKGKGDYATTVGLRSSYNQRFAAAVAAGARVFVCDNMSFTGEIKINRKQTKFAYQDLVRMVMEAMGRLTSLWKTQEERFEGYKNFELTEAQVHDILIRSLDSKVFANSYITKVLNEWRNPRHPEFEGRTIWSLFNSYTEVFKQSNPLDLTARTVRLEGLLDSVVNATESKQVVDGLLFGRAPRIEAPAQHGVLELVGLAEPSFATA